MGHHRGAWREESWGIETLRNTPPTETCMAADSAVAVVALGLSWPLGAVASAEASVEVSVEVSVEASVEASVAASAEASVAASAEASVAASVEASAGAEESAEASAGTEACSEHIRPEGYSTAVEQVVGGPFCTQLH
jgi:hypothetical protein